MIRNLVVIAAPVALLIAGSVAISPAIAATAMGGMPPAQQNAMVLKYCTVCHTDAHPNGLLSLEHFDAAHPDPGIAAMIVSKLKAKALGASGQPLPDRATQDALFNALSAESAGAHAWVVNQEASILSANIVEEAPAATGGADPDLYRLTLTCDVDSHEGATQVAWSPGVPKNGQVIFVAVDTGAPSTYKVEGVEKMGNGQAGDSGPGAIKLKLTSLPEKRFTISDVFQNEKVLFPFDSLAMKARKSLLRCFGGKNGIERLP